MTENYYSFMKDVVKNLIRIHKDEILEQEDWWYGLYNFSVNVHCLQDNSKSPDAVFSVNVYKVGEDGMDDYSIQWDLEPRTRKEIELA